MIPFLNISNSPIEINLFNNYDVDLLDCDENFNFYFSMYVFYSLNLLLLMMRLKAIMKNKKEI